MIRAVLWSVLALAGCKALFAKTSVVVYADYPASVQVDQLRFTSAVGANTIFGPVARPFAEGGGALAPPQSLEFDVNDNFGGKTASIHVSGFWQGKEVTNGDSTFTFKKQDFVEVQVTMTDLHTDCSKCATCCQDGFCLDASSLSACGVGGEVCVTCDPIRADNCSDAGVCQCGTSGLECSGGQHCVGGTCTCDDISCLGGCCDGNNCESRTQPTCGADGGSCSICDKLATDGCSATGVCQCGIDVPCGPNLHCVSGACQCDSLSCPDGCCEGNVCFKNQDALHCGSGGNACSGCPGPFVCDAGRCSSCNAANCGNAGPAACCAGDQCTPVSLTACGTSGGVCNSCDPTKADTCDSVTGTCKCGSASACGDGLRCVGSACTCDGTSCPNGCCEGGATGSCVDGLSTAACGTGGNSCSPCQVSCNGGVCTDCNSSNCIGASCCTGSTCQSDKPATGCATDGGACIACDTKSDSCAGGQCVCGTSGAACAPGQHCVSGSCVCDDTSCSALGKCCSGNQCVSAAPTTCGTGTGTASAQCKNCATAGATTDTCDATSFTCECGAGVTCPNNADGASANICSSGACVCGSGAACSAGLVCSGSGTSATCVCDTTACGAHGGCCTSTGAGSTCITIDSAADCGAGGICAQCTGTTDTCNASKSCQCGGGAGVSCPTSANGVTNANVCSGGACVCGSTGAPCGQGMKCSGAGALATCVCDTTACSSVAVNGCCMSDLSACITGGVTFTACGVHASPASGICVDCSLSNRDNLCSAGVCQCGSNPQCPASVGVVCTGAAPGGSCTCDATKCAALNGCCNGSPGNACVTAETTTQCGKAGTQCDDCTFSSGAHGKDTNLCDATSGTCKCGTSAACGAGLDCNNAGGTSATCFCSLTTGCAGCCSGGTVCNATSGDSACGLGGVVCDTCDSRGVTCSAGTCVCTSGNCANGCCTAASGNTATCVAAGTDSTQCNTLGGTCIDCDTTHGTANGCSAAGACTCGPSSCTNGCCDGSSICQKPLADPGTCTTSGFGTACVDCSSSDRFCDVATTHVCKCDAVSCPTGCCDGSGNCVTVPSDTQCSAGGVGGSCVDCAATFNTGCESNVCTCDATTCPAGCCDGGGHCQTDEGPTTCGLNGVSCLDCSATSCDAPSGTCN